MALKDLSPRQMVQITAAWLDPERERPRLVSLKRCAPLIDDVEAAHDGILKSHRRQKKANDELAAIQQKQVAVDQVHDRKARGAHAVLTGFADLADDPEDAAIYLEIRDQLFADGLKFISASYSDEAGEVKLARDRLTPESKAALRALPTPGGNLLKAVQAWFAAGDELGKLDAQRVHLEAQDRPGEANSPGGQLRARNRWIKVVRSVLQMLELEGPDAETMGRLLAPLQRETAKAERRRSNGKETDAEGGAPPGEPSIDEDALGAGVD
ncbi:MULTISPECIES: hypothetical protein [Sorangium]|uniref:Uncharacterized protein n=1 Tax=Sorangium cellulosum TaxID=56 RepID=A0A4P2QG30_SORCE|nr:MULTISPECIES: hypothetical protein [Sorangium]AUX28830.1 hypothetical protein SOCE836_009150 [Sorangium cellulosum]WCQ88228.1 hypothetical protein NQZ70_00903 [Sorangium sp. Soce836]